MTSKESRPLAGFFFAIFELMKILLTGANGVLGVHLTRQLVSEGFELVCTGRADPIVTGKEVMYEKMDFTDPFSIHDVFEKYKPGVVIHAGAMTRVDACEDNQWLAYISNVEGTLSLLSNAAETKSFFVFISTDFVFDGEKGNYTESEKTGPVNFYGKTKRDAEEAVLEYEYDWAIVRTSLVYGNPLSGKDNIISTIKRKLEAGDSYGLVNDQFRSPTFVEDLAKGILLIIKKHATGIYHISGKEILTPYEMGIKTATHLNAPRELITELNSTNFSQPAKRPVKTNLSIEKAVTHLGYDPVSFEEGLKRTCSSINSS